MMSSLDLFSGIGGITHALRGLCRPVGYCDWEQDSISVLESNMARGLLPRAPVCEDVRDLDATWFRRNGIGRTDVDIVVGGFPCVGFSPLGSRQGVKNPETGLFYEIMRILDVCRSPFVFLENVPNLLSLGMDIVTHELGRRGYEVRWCVVSAADMGAPHERRRWFCLGVRRHARFTWKATAPYKAFSWRPPGPCRTIPVDSVQARVRTALLGNSVVPDAVRHAFLFLVGRCVRQASVVRIDMAPAARSGAYGPTRRRRRTYPTCGVVRLDGSMETHRPPPASPHVPSRLTFDPRAFRTKKSASPLLTSGLIETRMMSFGWATPRHGMLRACNYLTERSIRDLPTQIRFERRTRHRDGGMSPEFVEWLMGYPRRWTAL